MQLLKELFEGVQCDSDLFKLYVSEDKYIMGYMSADRYYNPDKSFLVYKTLYDTIVDLDRKSKSHLILLYVGCSFNIDKFNMVVLPSAGEEAIYYTENVVFRTSSRSNLLAQLYSVRHKRNNNPDKVYYSQLFHNDAR